MTDYTVVWRFDISAESPRHAAELAQEIAQNHDYDWMYEVTDNETGEMTKVDLDICEYDESKEKRDFDCQLAEDIIEQNCCGCPEFDKPSGMSACWCLPIHDIVDQELYRIDDCTEERESSVASEWEKLRGAYLRDDDIPCENK